MATDPEGLKPAGGVALLFAAGFDGLPTQIQLLGSGDALVAFLHESSQVGKFLGTGENPGPQVMERVGIQAQPLPLIRHFLKG